MCPSRLRSSGQIDRRARPTSDRPSVQWRRAAPRRVAPIAIETRLPALSLHRTASRDTRRRQVAANRRARLSATRARRHRVPSVRLLRRSGPGRVPHRRGPSVQLQRRSVRLQLRRVRLQRRGRSARLQRPSGRGRQLPLANRTIYRRYLNAKTQRRKGARGVRVAPRCAFASLRCKLNNL